MIIEENGTICTIPEPILTGTSPKHMRGLLGLKSLKYNPEDGTFGSPSYDFKWPGRAPMEAQCNKCVVGGGKATISASCGCGLYASLLTKVSIGNYARTDNHVIGIMEGWGLTRMGANGFASEWGRIVGMVNLDKNGNKMTYDNMVKSPMMISNFAAKAFFGVGMYSLEEAEVMMVFNWMRLYKIHGTEVPWQLRNVHNKLVKRLSK